MSNGIEVFQGNYDRSTDVESELSFPATARYIRVIPLQCNGACAGNFEVVGGPVEKCQVIDNIALTKLFLVVILSSPTPTNISYVPELPFEDFSI